MTAGADVNAEDPRQRVIRQAQFYARVFAAAAVIVALAGSALIARFALPGMPFLTAWVLVLGTIGTLVLVIVVVRGWMARSSAARDNDMDIDSRGEG